MDSYEIALLEKIAYHLSPGNKEFDQWRKDFKEQYGTAPTPEVPTKAVEPKPSEARRDEARENVGVKINLGEKIAAAWKSKK
jgi:hypothetical protein